MAKDKLEDPNRFFNTTANENSNESTIIKLEGLNELFWPKHVEYLEDLYEAEAANAVDDPQRNNPEVGSIGIGLILGSFIGVNLTLVTGENALMNYGINGALAGVAVALIRTMIMDYLEANAPEIANEEKVLEYPQNSF